MKTTKEEYDSLPRKWEVAWDDESTMITYCVDPGKNIHETLRMIGQGVASWVIARCRDCNMPLNPYTATLISVYFNDGAGDILRREFSSENDKKPVN